MRREVVGLEGIDVDGSVHIYFGPVPSLLRLPVMLFTDRFDGRLTTLSMLAAMLVLAAAAYRLTVAVRRFVRPDAAVTRLELVLTGALSVTVLAGPPYWLTSVATVHHEALLWGVALMVAALDAIARWGLEPSGKRLAAASALVAATLLARNTLGWGALAALAVTGGMLARERLLELRRARAPSKPGMLLAGMILLACAVPLAVSVIPNLARFGQPFGVPFDRQLAMHAPEWREHLEHNEGELFGPRYVTTTLVNYLRPNALHFRSDLPWVDYPQPIWSTIGGGEVVADPTASLPATAPLLTLLAILGGGILLHSLVRRGPPTRLIWLWAGSLVATVGVILLGSVAQRYLTDLYPAVLVPGLVGFYSTVGWAGRWRRAHVLTAVAGAVMLAVGATAVTTMLALQYQREQLAYIPESWRASWAGQRAALPLTNTPWQVGLREPLPAEVPDGTMVVAGDCDGLYVSVSGPEPIWRPVEVARESMSTTSR